MSKKVRELRRLLSVVLAFVLIVTAPSVSVLADDAVTSVKSGTCGDGLTWVLDSNGTLTISGSGEMEDYNYDYDWLGSPSPWNEEKKSVKKIVVEQGVTGIGDDSFHGCSGLTDITISDSVTSIGAHAFCGCSGLTSITIPDGVTSIGELAFDSCSGLTSITIPDGVTSIGYGTFYNCSRLTSITISDGVTSIGYGTFYNCSRLISITIPDGVTSIGTHAFYNCSGLTGITIPDGVTSIGDYTFCGCSGLTSITIPDGVTSIGTRIYADCSNLSKIYFEGDSPKCVEVSVLLSTGWNIDSGHIFDGVTATAYYPAGNTTYTDEVKKAYGGNITWVERGSGIDDTPGLTGWSDEGFWYENGVKQGVQYNEDGSIDLSYRGKEIYDPISNAWYWLDNIQNGAVAKSKDVYQESAAGAWADNKVYNEDGSLNTDASTGKWVRYDENGHMIKGWNTNDAGTYYFDTVYGTMAKGHVVIGDNECYFDESTGIGYNGWLNVDGMNYWYENGIRQGYNVNDKDFRGKEIYDAASDAWYWLDNVQNGAVAKSKDVYQESYAGIFADREDGTGKWVRYDADGHMIKGWSEMNGNTYYFDYQTGAMAKGWANIDGADYYFDEATGIMR